jgi:hypothetical protein
MQTVEVSNVAVLVSAVVYMVLGFLWYGPLFGKPWMKLVGMTKEHMEEAKKKGMGKTYGLSFVGALVMFYVLAHFAKYAQASTMTEGMQTGFWAWLGFVATTGMNEFLFAVKKKPWKLYFINQGYLLIGLLVGGAILATWT